jgi:GNAT superfamily N-acetyltransferase
MPALHAFAKSDVPRDVAIQVRSYQRIQWPHLDERIGGKLWDVPRDLAVRTFVVLDDEKLVSHAEANFRPLEHAGQMFTVGGLSAVFTYPAYREHGFAQQVVRAATDFLDASPADMALLFCGERLRDFYTTFGWEALGDDTRIFYGDRAHPTPHAGNVVMARFISTHGHDARATLAREPLFVGERTW